MRDPRRLVVPVFLFLLAIASGAAVQAYSGYTLDDAYIGYRYAENLAEGAEHHTKIGRSPAELGSSVAVDNPDRFLGALSRHRSRVRCLDQRPATT